ncbi:hypothetical protein ABT236_09685 [Streptomyces sp. NPDC001523]|uniref:tetratricopeptide repeat protein n=1 Tax=Streptomyces sp. NPDC001523 TaxID=3154383 RepID=UPI00331FE74F
MAASDRSLRDIVLGPGRETLRRLRSGTPPTRDRVAADPVLRAGVLYAARHDPRAEDLSLLRFLLECECECECESGPGAERFEERWLAAALVAAHGREEDVALLRTATSGQVTDSAGAVEWARARQESDAEAESEFTWIELARRQGRLASARDALIRLLDDAGPDPDRLRKLSRALERLGDHAQATRAQIHLLSLRHTDRDRASEECVLARLERGKGDLDAAGRALSRARAAVGAPGAPPDATVAQWHRRGLGRKITEQHLELVLAAVEAGDPELARRTMAHARRLLDTIGKETAKALSRLSTRAKWAVAGLERPHTRTP